MKALLRKLGLATALVAVVLSLFAGASSAATPTSYEDDWDNTQNQEQYWEDLLSDETRSVDCTKYKRHNGFIPAEYDAAVIKDGKKVRVYPDLTDVGAFTAVGATNPNNGKPFAAPHSWVMKCKFTPTTTTSTTTSTTTTVPEDVEVTAVVPEVAVEDECSGRGILTIPDIEGIIFDLDNVPSGPGEYEVTSGDVVKATAREGFVLTNPDFEYVVEVTINEDCVTTTTVAETTTTEKPEVSSTSVVKPQAAAEELAFTGSSSTVGTLLGAVLLLMGAVVLFFGRRKTTD